MQSLFQTAMCPGKNPLPGFFSKIPLEKKEGVDIIGGHVAASATILLTDLIFIITQSCEVVMVIILILEMRKSRLRG